MKRNGFIASVILVCVLAGCGATERAERLMAPNAEPGRTDLKLTSSPKQLVEQKRIAAHRTIAAPDGTPIDVWVIRADAANPRPGRKGTVILLHRRMQSKASFPYLGAGERLAKMGYDVVLPDLRGHGASGGKYVTFGVKEKDDIKAVMDALAKDKLVSGPFYVFGDGLGGAVALHYAAIDPRVKGVMVIAPYKDIRSIAQRFLYPLDPMELTCKTHLDETIEAAGQLGQFEPAEASSVAAASKLKAPLLVVAPVLDLSVPLEHIEAIYNAGNEPKSLFMVTPGPEQLALGTMMENWIADKIDDLAVNGVKSAATKPAATTKPAN